MTVYIEYAIIDNLVINSLLLWFVFRTIKQVPKWGLIFISAAVGTVAALVMPMLYFDGAAMFFVKVFIGAGMVFIVQNKSLARFTLFYLLFFIYTFALGGAIYGVLFMCSSASASLLYFTYNTSVPIGVFVIGLAVMAKMLSVSIKFLNIRHSVNNYLRDVVIHFKAPQDRTSRSEVQNGKDSRQYKNEKIRITSYLDTGNRLVDPVSRAPVIIITLSLFLKMFPDVSVDRVFLNKLNQMDIADGHYINFSTVDKANGKMFVFAPEKIDVMEHKGIKSHDNVRLGVSLKGFRDAVKYDALLNASLA